MTDNVDQVAATIATNLRDLRAALGLTLDGLGTVTGLSKGTLVALEQGRGNPSIGTLCQLSETLGIGLQQLLEDQSTPFIKVRRARDAAALWTTAEGSEARFLLGTDPPDGIELWEWTIAPGEHFDGGAHPPGSRELLAVRSGGLKVIVGEHLTELAAGDSMLFEATVDHQYTCATTEPVHFAMVVLISDLSGLGPMEVGEHDHTG